MGECILIKNSISTIVVLICKPALRYNRTQHKQIVMSARKVTKKAIILRPTSVRNYMMKTPGWKQAIFEYCVVCFIWTLSEHKTTKTMCPEESHFDNMGHILLFYKQNFEQIYKTSDASLFCFVCLFLWYIFCASTNMRKIFYNLYGPSLRQILLEWVKHTSCNLKTSNIKKLFISKI